MQAPPRPLWVVRPGVKPFRRAVAPPRAAPYLTRMTTAPASESSDQVTLSTAAAARVLAIAARQGKPAILRLAVDGGGCSGFQYRFELADAPEPDDVVSTVAGATLVVDPASLDLIAGAQVDFVESLGGAAFRVTNPQAAAGCGCGSSFAV